MTHTLIIPWFSYLLSNIRLNMLIISTLDQFDSIIVKGEFSANSIVLLLGLGCRLIHYGYVTWDSFCHVELSHVMNLPTYPVGHIYEVFSLPQLACHFDNCVRFNQIQFTVFHNNGFMSFIHGFLKNFHVAIRRTIGIWKYYNCRSGSFSSKVDYRVNDDSSSFIPPL